jgi:membrane-bound lytic murein transglycosylase D
MNRNKIYNHNVVKKIGGSILYSGLMLSFMSFSAPSGRSLPVPGRNKKDDIALPVDPKDGTKNFVSLLPAVRPATANAVKKANTSSITKAVLNPEVRDFVDNYIHYEKDDLTKMKVSAQPIFKLMDAILIRYNLPTQLKYIAVIESNLEQNVRMSSGATGPWQLMHEEGVSYGLIKNGHDYRTDYAKSTEAAAKIFVSLYNRYHDWLLAIAAYNCGIGRMHKAITAAGSTDFWKVQNYLPKETRNYVKKYISTNYFFEGSGGITTMGASETKKYNQQSAQNITKNRENDNAVSAATGNDNEVIRIQGLYSKNAICKILNINVSTFDKANPDFDQALSNGQFYDLRLPDGKADEFKNKKDEILQQSFNALLNDDANDTTDNQNKD